MDNCLDKSMDAIEKQVIATVMRATKGNKVQAAKALGLYRPTFYSKLKKHGLSEPTNKQNQT